MSSSISSGIEHMIERMPEASPSSRDRSKLIENAWSTIFVHSAKPSTRSDIFKWSNICKRFIHDMIAIDTEVSETLDNRVKRGTVLKIMSKLLFPVELHLDYKVVQEVDKIRVNMWRKTDAAELEQVVRDTIRPEIDKFAERFVASLKLVLGERDYMRLVPRMSVSIDVLPVVKAIYILVACAPLYGHTSGSFVWPAIGSYVDDQYQHAIDNDPRSEQVMAGAINTKLAKLRNGEFPLRVGTVLFPAFMIGDCRANRAVVLAVRPSDRPRIGSPSSSVTRSQRSKVNIRNVNEAVRMRVGRDIQVIPQPHQTAVVRRPPITPAKELPATTTTKYPYDDMDSYERELVEQFNDALNLLDEDMKKSDFALGNKPTSTHGDSSTVTDEKNQRIEYTAEDLASMFDMDDIDFSAARLKSGTDVDDDDVTMKTSEESHVESMFNLAARGADWGADETTQDLMANASSPTITGEKYLIMHQAYANRFKIYFDRIMRLETLLHKRDLKFDGGDVVLCVRATLFPLNETVTPEFFEAVERLRGHPEEFHNVVGVFRMNFQRMLEQLDTELSNFAVSVDSENPNVVIDAWNGTNDIYEYFHKLYTTLICTLVTGPSVEKSAVFGSTAVGETGIPFDSDVYVVGSTYQDVWNGDFDRAVRNAKKSNARDGQLMVPVIDNILMPSYSLMGQVIARGIGQIAKMVTNTPASTDGMTDGENDVEPIYAPVMTIINVD